MSSICVVLITITPAYISLQVALIHGLRSMIVIRGELVVHCAVPLPVYLRKKQPYADGNFLNSFNGDLSPFEEKCCEAKCSGNLSPAKLYCFNCSIFMCFDCNNLVHSNEKGHDVKSLMELQKCQLLQPPQCSIRDTSSFLTFRSYSDSSMTYCKTHREPMRIYCETDNTIICVYCQLHGDHKGHNCVLIDEMATLKREALQGLKEELNTKQTECVLGFNLCKRAEEDVSERKIKLKTELDTHFDFLYSALASRKKQLESDINEMAEQTIKVLSTQSRFVFAILPKVCIHALCLWMFYTHAYIPPV